MRLPALALALSALIASPAFAETFKTPKALLQALYSFDAASSDDSPSPYSAFFSDHLNELLQADLDKTAEGDVGAIDFDPVIAGQDGEASDLRIGQPILLNGRAELEVQFRNGENVTLYYRLVKEHGGWKVEDIANQQGEAPWSLSALLGDEE
ncbi:YbjP/YqhG family protein [Rhizobium sp. Pop5]|uniref:DUF3828 domain-containing protein n=1 Tax=Rhizobium sp. Pop5 TaxID=1223565 RepID=UPI00028386DA|nr:DUF3828 domain-containing protein [Rhizobium sp. Pop5]EJZ17415.1 hypothetical protein RCCGEPOP_30854 [Rhizobium sp. Pop5]UVD58996.1 YbjP/YqhG family protein [Rhizobium sp. Pop5]